MNVTQEVRRLSYDSQRILQVAARDAHMFGRIRIEPEHLIIALIRAGYLKRDENILEEHGRTKVRSAWGIPLQGVPD